MTLKRMAKLTPTCLSFKQALLLGLSGSHVSSSKNTLRYNGEGLSGDRQALTLDMVRSIK